MKKELRIVFMGTPDFAVTTLREIVNAGYNVSAVVTMPDKPAGRGQKLQTSPVKDFALEQQIPVLQPQSLKSPEFIDELRSYHANLQVVVAFRMLPEAVWQMPQLGTINLHASLLPHYRGAAPINHAVINGDTETGVTTFFIEKEIDTGKIILSEKLSIYNNDTAGTLHDRLAKMGSKLVVKTLQLIENGQVNEVSQEMLMGDKNTLKPAPKIFKTDCRIDWSNSNEKLYNFIRGLSPYPAAYSFLQFPDGSKKQIKIFATSPINKNNKGKPGSIEIPDPQTLLIKTGNGWLKVEELQLEGKRRMGVAEFLRGLNINPQIHTFC